MPNRTPLINGEAYSWSQITLNILGVTVAGITEVNYDDTQNFVKNYGQGNMPISRGKGQYEANASIGLTMEEIEALTNQAPNRRLQDIPEFDLIVSYIPDGGQGVVTHVIRNAVFTNNARSITRGDTEVAAVHTLNVSHIDW